MTAWAALTGAPLGDNMGGGPALIIACIDRAVNGALVTGATALGSVLPAAWSFMLAARARGLGTCWTTLHLMFQAEVAEVLAIPETVAQAVLTPVAYTLGTDFRPAKRPDPELIHTLRQLVS